MKSAFAPRTINQRGQGSDFLWSRKPRCAAQSLEHALVQQVQQRVGRPGNMFAAKVILFWLAKMIGDTKTTTPQQIQTQATRLAVEAQLCICEFMGICSLELQASTMTSLHLTCVTLGTEQTSTTSTPTDRQNAATNSVHSWSFTGPVNFFRYFCDRRASPRRRRRTPRFSVRCPSPPRQLLPRPPSPRRWSPAALP